MNTKEINIDLLPMPGGKSIEGAKGEICINLRRDKCSGLLSAVAMPGSLTKQSTDGEASVNRSLPGKLIGIIENATVGRIALCHIGKRLRAEYLDVERDALELGLIEGEVTVVNVTSSTCVVIMTTAQPYRVIIDDNGGCYLAWRTRYTPLRFSTHSELTMTQSIEERSLSGTYDTHSTRLTDADASTLATDLLNAYEELERKIRLSGLVMQPLLARYRLLGGDGATLYISPTVVVAPSTGVQCVDELSCLLADDRSSRNQLTLSSKACILQLIKADENQLIDAPEVKKLVVEISLPVHPIDRNASAANALNQSGTNDVMLRCFVPGCSLTMVSSRKLATKRLLALARKGDIAFHTAKVIHNPFAAENICFDINPYDAACESIDSQMSAVAKILSAQVDEVDEVVAGCRTPNIFTANVGCTASEAVAWGDITMRGFAGYSIEEVTAKSGDEASWSAKMAVIMADGSRRIALSWGTGAAPTALSPLLCYPSGKALKIEVSLSADDVTYYGEYPLSPSDDGTMALYLDENCKCIELPQSDITFAMEDDSPGNAVYHAAALCCHAHNPLCPTDITRPATGCITALTPVDRRGSSWDYSRRRIYIMYNNGIFLSTIGNGRWANTSRIDSRGPASTYAVATTDDDKYPVVCIANSSLLGLSRGTVTTLEQNISATSLAWEHTHSELWLIDPDYTIRVGQQPGGEWFILKGLNPVQIVNYSRGLILQCDSSTLDTALNSTYTTDIEIAYGAKFNTPKVPGHAKRCATTFAELSIGGTITNGTLALFDREILGREWQRRDALLFEGEGEWPLAMRIAARLPRAEAMLRLDAHTHPGALLGRLRAFFTHH